MNEKESQMILSDSQKYVPSFSASFQEAKVGMHPLSG